ncbi:MAG TPA: proton-conducting transporter membrane subunit [Stenomitos sp.]
MDTLRLMLPDLLLLALILGLAFTRRHAGLVALYGLIVIAGFQLGSFWSGAGTGTVGGMLQLDAFAVTGRVALLLAAAGVVALGLDRLPEGLAGGRKLALMLLSLLGAFLLPAASDLVMVYLGLELLWLPACVTLLRPTDGAAPVEGALKTFFYGAGLSATYLFGTTLLYGLSGTTDLGGVARQLMQLGTTTNGPMLLGALLVVGALAAKIALVPFHAYYPDAIEESTGTSTAYLLVVPLMAGAMVVMRVLFTALPSARDLWAPLLVVACLLTLVVGPVLALAQTDLKRILASAVITQAGFWSLGLLALAHPDSSRDALASVLMGTFTTGLALLAALAVLQALSAERLMDLSGLFQRSPGLAVCLAVACLGLSGLPPVAGFWAKLLLFKSVVSYANAAMAYGLVWLVAIAGLSALVLSYALMRPLRVAFFEPVPEAAPVALSPGLLAVAGLGAVGSILLFLLPHALWQPVLAAVAGL